MVASEPLRETLLDVAIRHFGAHGFQGAGTRAIASECNTAMSSITYHFGGKEGLYLAAADHIAKGVTSFMHPMLDGLRSRGEKSPEEAAEAVIELLQGFATMMLSDRSQPWASFIIREQQQPSEAFDRLYAGAMRPVFETLVALIENARPDLGNKEACASAMVLMGQVFMLRAARASVCRALDVETLDGAAEELLRERIAVHTRCVLSANGKDFG